QAPAGGAGVEDHRQGVRAGAAVPHRPQLSGVRGVERGTNMGQGSGMSAARYGVFAAWLLVSACAPSTAERADIKRAITSLQSDDRVERTLGAIAAQHVIKRQGRFSLL